MVSTSTIQGDQRSDNFLQMIKCNDDTDGGHFRLVLYAKTDGGQWCLVVCTETDDAQWGLIGSVTAVMVGTG